MPCDSSLLKPIGTVYLAAHFQNQRVCRDVFRPALERVHLRVRARWLDEADPPKGSDGYPVLTDAFQRQCALVCLEDILAADALVLYNPDDMAKVGTGGRMVELGMALAFGLPVAIVGSRSNVFCHSNGVWLVCPTADAEDKWAESVAEMVRLSKEPEQATQERSPTKSQDGENGINTLTAVRWLERNQNALFWNLEPGRCVVAVRDPKIPGSLWVSEGKSFIEAIREARDGRARRISTIFARRPADGAVGGRDLEQLLRESIERYNTRKP
jgi:hypothetical protein